MYHIAPEAFGHQLTHFEGLNSKGQRGCDQRVLRGIHITSIRAILVGITHHSARSTSKKIRLELEYAYGVCALKIQTSESANIL